RARGAAPRSFSAPPVVTPSLAASQRFSGARVPVARAALHWQCACAGFLRAPWWPPAASAHSRPHISGGPRARGRAPDLPPRRAIAPLRQTRDVLARAPFRGAPLAGV